MAAHAALKKAGLDDAQDSYFWVDPFSPEGQQVAAKLLPVAAELRLHAERAITLLAQARAAGKLENPKRSMQWNLARGASTSSATNFRLRRKCASLYAKAQTLAGDKSQWSEVSEALAHDRFEQRTP